MNSRRKGKVNELEWAALTGGKRVGYLHKSKADVITERKAYQVKADKQISWNQLICELDDLIKYDAKELNYLAVKKKRGRWLVIETAEQHNLQPKEKCPLCGLRVPLATQW